MSAEIEVRPLNVWLAVLLGLFVPLVGFAYIGRLALGVAVFAVVPVAMFVFGRTGWLHSLPVFYLFAAFAVLVQLWTLYYVWRQVRNSVDLRPRVYDRWFVYVGLLVFSVVSSQWLASNRGYVFGFETYRIPSVSMSPTLSVGDMVLADMRSVAVDRLERGDIVVYRASLSGDAPVIGRVVGLPGETVSAGARDVDIDGAGLIEPYLSTNRDAMPPMPPSSQTLGADEYFILGDNRSHSDDSRFRGPCRGDHIIGKVSAIWWSSDFDRIGLLNSGAPSFSERSK